MMKQLLWGVFCSISRRGVIRCHVKKKLRNRPAEEKKGPKPIVSAGNGVKGPGMDRKRGHGSLESGLGKGGQGGGANGKPKRGMTENGHAC